MKRIFVVGLSLAIAVSQAFTQTQVPTDKFDALHKSAISRLDRLSYRETRKVEDLISRDGSVERTVDYVILVVPPNSRHTVRRHTDRSGVSQSENIVIGKIRYFRLGDGTWEKEAFLGDRFTMIPDKGDQVEVEFKREVDLEGKKAEHYFVTRTFGSSPNTRIKIEQVWFSKDGLLLRTIVEGGIGQGTTHRKETTTYEYVRNLRIRAPIK